MGQTKAQKSEIEGHQFSTIKTYQNRPPEAIFWPDATRDSFEGLKMLSNEATRRQTCVNSDKKCFPMKQKSQKALRIATKNAFEMSSRMQKKSRNHCK